MTTPGRGTTRRPETARPRADAQATAPAPPSDEELEGMERGLTRLVQLLGARTEESAELGGRLVSLATRGPAFNHLAMVRWSPTAWEETAAALTRRFRASAELPAVVIVERRTIPGDLAAKLSRAGWVRVVAETAMWTRRAAVVPHLDRTLRIENVTSRSVAEYERVERLVFGLSSRGAEDRTRALVGTLEAGTQRAYLVRVQGVPSAICRLVLHDGIAALHGIGVIPERRRQGLGRLVTTVATRAALAMGASLVWLSVTDGNEPARRLYASLDYRPAFGWQLMVRP